jgi:hypothetical protein
MGTWGVCPTHMASLLGGTWTEAGSAVVASLHLLHQTNLRQQLCHRLHRLLDAPLLSPLPSTGVASELEGETEAWRQTSRGPPIGTYKSQYDYSSYLYSGAMVTSTNLLRWT